MMLRFAALVTLLSAAALVDALPTNAGGCAGGQAATSAPHSPPSGSIQDGGYSVAVTSDEAGMYTVTLTAGDTPFKGFLLRLDDALLEDFDDATTQSSPTCFEPGVAGATHIANDEKSEVSATFSSDSATTVDVTIVQSTAVVYYSAVELPAGAAEPPMPPVDEEPPMPPADEEPPMPPVDEEPPMPPADEEPPMPVDEEPPMPPVDEEPMDDEPEVNEDEPTSSVSMITGVVAAGLAMVL